MTVSDVLQRITTALEQSDVAYMLTGSFVSAYYGTPRSTQDIDVIVEATPGQLSAFVSSLPIDQYYVDLDAALQALKAESMFNVVDRTTGWKIDFIIRKSRPFNREEFRRRMRAHLQGVFCFCGQHGGYCHSQARMVYAGAIAKQIDDVAAILRIRRETLDRAYIEKWTRELRIEGQWVKARDAAEM